MGHLRGIDQLPFRHPEGIVGVVHAEGPEDLEVVPVDALHHDGRRILDGLIERPVLLLGLPVAGLPRTLSDPPHDAPGDAVHRGLQDGLQAQPQKGLGSLGRLGGIDQVPVVIQDEPAPSFHRPAPRLVEPLPPFRTARQSGQPGASQQGPRRPQKTPTIQGRRLRPSHDSVIDLHGSSGIQHVSHQNATRQLSVKSGRSAMKSSPAGGASPA